MKTNASSTPRILYSFFSFFNFFSSAADFGIAKVMHGKFAQTIVGKLAVLLQKVLALLVQGTITHT
jgi:hypothetical protein